MKLTEPTPFIPTPKDRERNQKALAIATMFHTTGGLTIIPKDPPSPLNIGITDMEGLNVETPTHQDTLAKVLTQLNQNSGNQATVSITTHGADTYPDPIKIHLFINGQVPLTSQGEKQEPSDLLKSVLFSGQFERCQIDITTPPKQEESTSKTQLFIYGHKKLDRRGGGTPLRICVSS